jgi:hypothetical protein
MKPKNNAENFGKCICINCPLYTDCNKNNAERIFCARTKAGCPMDDKKNCICPKDCPVYEDNNLTGAYFCKIDSER